MVITKNYVVVTPILQKILFREENHVAALSYHLNSIHNIKQIGVIPNLMYLDYYGFNILISRTSNQASNFSKLDDDFFQRLSKHKQNLAFIGFFDENDMTFTPQEMIYHMPNAELGIHLRKRIMKEFRDKGVEVIVKAQTQKKNYTSFIIT